MLYPPILASTQPVFDTTILRKKGLVIDFTLASITSIDDFDTVELILCKQSNNATVAKQSYAKSDVMLDTKIGQIVDKSIASNSDFQPGYLYKVQLRLIKVAGNTQEVSEWSTVLIIKFITTPSIQVSAEGIILSPGSYVSSLTPTFKGICNIDTSNKEVEELFQFKIYQESTVIVESGWLNSRPNEEDVWYCNTKLSAHTYYSVFYEIKTINGYSLSTICAFQVVTPAQTVLDADFFAEVNQEKARIDLSIVPGSTLNKLNGIYVISRASEKDDFSKFEDIRFLSYKEEAVEEGKSYFVFSDYTIESGVNYKYGIQQVRSSSLRSELQETGIVMINYSCAYFYREGVQLKVSFNQNISNFKYTVLRNKQDTIGSKYPYFSQNGNAHYAEFALTGLISYQDNIDTFFNVHNDENVYYKDELVIHKEKFELNTGKREASTTPGENSTYFDHKDGYAFGVASQETSYAYENDLIATLPRRGSSPIPTDDSNNGTTDEVELTRDYTISTNLTDDNIYIERKFREKVEEFLNDFNGKLYKSATEGNHAIILMNVSLRPEETLGRLLYSFNATAYEIADTTIEDLDFYGISNIQSNLLTKYDPIIYNWFGQVILDSSETNIIEKIKTQIDQEFESLYQLKDLDTLWIETSLSREDLYSNYYVLYIDDTKNIIPTNRIYTLAVPSIINQEEDTAGYKGVKLTLEKGHVPLLVNFKASIEQNPLTATTYVTRESKYDFDQIIWNRSDGEDLVEFIQNIIATRSKWIEISEDENGIKTWKDQEGIIWTFDHLRWIDITTQKGAIISIGVTSADSTDFKVGYVHNSENPRENTFNSNRIIFPTQRSELDSHAKYLHISGEYAQQAIVNFSYYLLKDTIMQG